MELVDTHCHIHEATPAAPGTTTKSKWSQAGIVSPGPLIERAIASSVTRLICVGTTLADSQLAVELAGQQAACWASIGLHPHEAKEYVDNPRALRTFKLLASQPRVVAIGECGLDYFYNHSPPVDQQAILKFQLQIAKQHDLPVIFHVRDAFNDFWPIFDQFAPLRGVIHSFSSTVKDLKPALARDLYIGLNGIMTFTKDEQQLIAARQIPLSKLLLETDAPYLTPTPERGKLCEPKHVRHTAEFLSQLRGESLSQLAQATTHNAKILFKLN